MVRAPLVEDEQAEEHQTDQPRHRDHRVAEAVVRLFDQREHGAGEAERGGTAPR